MNLVNFVRVLTIYLSYPYLFLRKSRMNRPRITFTKFTKFTSGRIREGIRPRFR